MVRTTQKPEGMLYEVLRDDTGQVVWSKFVPWGRWNRRQNEFEETACKQERIARQSINGGQVRKFQEATPMA
jgi:hypothetical protein